jgi:glutamate-1-semialdehyde 2,1-aminomutase
MRDWTEPDGSLLVFDEVITFRSEFGGLQSRYDVAPDLTAMGKIIGGGFPVGAIAGRAEVMDVMNPLADKVLFPHSGTFSANPITHRRRAWSRCSSSTKPPSSRVNELDGTRDARHRGGDRTHRAAACVTGGGVDVPRPHETAAARELPRGLRDRPRRTALRSCSTTCSTQAS